MQQLLADQLADQLVDRESSMTKKRLPARLHRLTVRELQTADDGEHADGGNLLLRVSGGAATWVFRYTAPNGKRREMGLGAAYRNNPAVAGNSLTAAREQAHNARTLLAQGIDPIDARGAQRRAAREVETAKKAEAKREQLTLARAARAYHERVIEPSRTTKHAAQWIASLENHVPDRLWHKPIGEITSPELLDFVAELQAKIPETASRIRQRLEVIFDDTEFRGLSTGNPARAIRRKLREVHRGRERGQFAALPFAQAPTFMESLRRAEGVAARCLEFAILTAARTGEAIGATWDEFDLSGALWTIPGSRMKGGEKHVVFLSPRAVEIVTAMKEYQQPYVFPSPALNDRPLSNMAMLMQLRRMKIADRTTVHGLCRSTFSTWAYENAVARPDVIEACLAHREQDRVKAAYNRAEFTTDRKALLRAWADYLEGKERRSKVVDLPARAVGRG